MMYCLCTSSRMLALMTAWRSVSMYSKIKYRSLSFSALSTFSSLDKEKDRVRGNHQRSMAVMSLT